MLIHQTRISNRDRATARASATRAPPSLEGKLLIHQTRISIHDRALSFSHVVFALDQWTHWIDNPYSAESTEDFSCEIDRGQQECATLFNLNHFLTNPIALQNLAEEGNHNPILRDHIFSCIESIGQIPNQIMVDFYSIGDLFLVAEEINQQFDRK